MILRDSDIRIHFTEEGFQLIHIPSTSASSVYENKVQNQNIARQELQTLIQDLEENEIE